MIKKQKVILLTHDKPYIKHLFKVFMFECCYCEDKLSENRMNFEYTLQCKQCNTYYVASSHYECYYYNGNFLVKKICNKCVTDNKIMTITTSLSKLFNLSSK